MRNIDYLFYIYQLLGIFVLTAILVNALLRGDWYWALSSSTGIISLIISGAIFSYRIRG